MIASLPMYDVNREAVERLWQGIAARLVDEGIAEVPASLQWPDDLSAHWRSKDLLLSQACGYPLTHELNHRVQLVGAFSYSAPGCEGVDYRSFLLVREMDATCTLPDFYSRRLAVNSLSSQSGFNSLLPLIPNLQSESNPFFSQTLISGSHRQSIEMIRNGTADLAAIDCVTLAGLKQADPSWLDGLCIIGETTPTPGLPLITSIDASPHQLLALRRALHGVVEDKALKPVLDALFITGFEQLPWSAYAPSNTPNRTAEVQP